MRFCLPQAPASAPEVDYLIAGLLLISLRRARAGVRSDAALHVQLPRRQHASIAALLAEKTWRFETAWTVATLLVFFGLFIWGADLYVRLFQPPADALKIYVVGKQWMWKVEHPGGQREINALHVPVGRADRAGDDLART